MSIPVAVTHNIIYSLPTALQLPLQNLVLVFFTLLLAHLNARVEQKTA